MNRIILRVLAIFSCVLFVCIIGKYVSPNGGSVSLYAEEYKFNIPFNQLIDKVEKFKVENPEYNVPIKWLHDEFDEYKHYYFVYLFFAEKNEVAIFWINSDDETSSTIGLIEICKIIYVKDTIKLQDGGWLNVNEDLSKFENKQVKIEFEEKILNKLDLKYKDEGNEMSLFGIQLP